ncbi:hypothetical protein [Nocardia sp. NPDC057030]|uniref:hypothetical protein n=1 Tax=unclassified Nocardia TaxID=2637762 RepID=UPI00362B79CD
MAGRLVGWRLAAGGWRLAEHAVTGRVSLVMCGGTFGTGGDYDAVVVDTFGENFDLAEGFT